MAGIRDNNQTLTQSLKIVFEGGTPPLYDFLNLFWKPVRLYDTTEIPADTVVASRKIARYREVNAGSNIFAYLPGKGIVYEPATLDESTPITEELSRAITAGLESNAPAQEQLAEKAGRIQKELSDIIVAATVKQAVDIMVTGKFQPTGKNGVAIGGVFDYGRDPDNTITAQADPIEALQDAWDQYKLKGGPLGNAFALIGPAVLSALEQSDEFMNALKLQGLYAGQSRLVGENRVVADIIPGGFKIPGRAARINLFSFDESYKDESNTLVSFMPAKGIIVSSTNAPRLRAYGGVYLTSQTGSIPGKIVMGEVVSDSFTSKNPDSSIFRSQSRPVCIPGEIDHIVYASIT
jgi:hypothetical protein